jgi:uncharacterized protein YgbK (DUF1537 family)
MALMWQHDGIVPRKTSFPLLKKRSQILVISGSCSPTSERQIRYALKHGFAGHRIDALKIVDAGQQAEEIKRAYIEAGTSLARGKSVILYTALGPKDPVLYKVQALGTRKHAAGYGEIIAKAQAEICRDLVLIYDLKRILISGGDTSGHIVKALETQALEMLAPVSPGAPLCIATSVNPAFDGLELLLKGGQLGGDDVFVRLR